VRDSERREHEVFRGEENRGTGFRYTIAAV